MELLSSYDQYIDSDKLICIFVRDDNDIKSNQSTVIKILSISRGTIVMNFNKLTFTNNNVLEWKILNKLILFICSNNLSNENQFHLISKILNRDEMCIFITDDIKLFQNYKEAYPESKYFYVARKNKEILTVNDIISAYTSHPYTSYECNCNTISPQLRLTSDKEITCLLTNYLLYLSTTHQIPPKTLANLYNKINYTNVYPSDRLLITIGEQPMNFFKNELWIGRSETAIEKIILLKVFKTFSTFLKKHLVYEISPDILKGFEDLEAFEYKYMY